MELMKQVEKTVVPAQKVAIFWLGQAGFLLKTHEGHTIVIDPYLSHYVEHLFPEMGLGFKRLMPPPCAPEEICADALLISHEHGDHFDVESIAALLQNGKTQVYTCHAVAEMMKPLAVDATRITVLSKGEHAQILPECLLTATDCDHGDLSPDAMGWLLSFGTLQVYFAGDTALTPARLGAAIAAKPDVALLPINGAFGNLNGTQAAEFAAMLGCKVIIPCHFWTFPLHHGDPQELIDAMPAKAPDVRLCLLQQGEAYLG